jgi:hypothetical protein
MPARYAQSLDIRMMVRRRKGVECPAKIAMTTLRSRLAAMGLLPDRALPRRIFLERHSRANSLIKKWAAELALINTRDSGTDRTRGISICHLRSA